MSGSSSSSASAAKRRKVVLPPPYQFLAGLRYAGGNCGNISPVIAPGQGAHRAAKAHQQQSQQTNSTVDSCTSSTEDNLTTQNPYDPSAPPSFSSTSTSPSNLSLSLVNLGTATAEQQQQQQTVWTIDCILRDPTTHFEYKMMKLREIVGVPSAALPVHGPENKPPPEASSTKPCPSSNSYSTSCRTTSTRHGHHSSSRNLNHGDLIGPPPSATEQKVEKPAPKVLPVPRPRGVTELLKKAANKTEEIK